MIRMMKTNDDDDDKDEEDTEADEDLSTERIPRSHTIKRMKMVSL